MSDKKHIPMRMCVACRTMHPKDELIRGVFDKETEKAVIDEKQKVQSRGIYICKTEKCIGLAKKKRAAERHLKCGNCEEFYERASELWIKSSE